MKRYWLVVPVDVHLENRDPIVTFREPEVAAPAGADEQQFAVGELRLNEVRGFLPAEARQNARRPARAAPAGVAFDNWGHPNGTVYGFKMARETRNEIEHCFEDRALAEEFAGKLAAKSPGKQYAVYESVRVFETTTPQILAKEFNGAGELIPLNTGEVE